jgi:hypothetical protein
MLSSHLPLGLPSGLLSSGYGKDIVLENSVLQMLTEMDIIKKIQVYDSMKMTAILLTGLCSISSIVTGQNT